MVMLVFCGGCGGSVDSEATSAIPPHSRGALFVGFDRSARAILWDEEGKPVMHTVATRLPVLHFAGSNASDEAIAYTTLEHLVPGFDAKREAVSWEESLDFQIENLVPTGHLVIENRDEIQLLSRDGEFVVFASWSPTDRNILAYGYTRADKSGVAIVNIQTRKRVASIEEGVHPDVFHWYDNGRGLKIYRESKSEMETLLNDEEHGEAVSYRSQDVVFFNNELIENDGEVSVIGQGLMYSSSAGMDMEIDAPAGKIFMADVSGGEDNELVTVSEGGDTGIQAFKAEQIRARNQYGIAYVNSNGSNIELYAVGGMAKSPSGNQPVLLAAAAAVSYYIPNPAGSTVNFTQVGQSYPGGGCLLKNHLNGSTMAYAIDIQLSGAAYDDVLASGNGTVSGFSASVTCNSGDPGTDGSVCTPYTNPCSNNGGWGNYVILSHSDGFFTKYTHLEQTSFQVHTINASASAGCWLAREGRSGNTSGGKNGCGDHLHFQRQSTSAVSGTSVAVSFVEDSSITSTDCTSKSPSRGGMSCAL